MFNENSGLVKIWVRLLTEKNNKYSISDVPNIDNLFEIVYKVLEKMGRV